MNTQHMIAAQVIEKEKRSRELKNLEQRRMFDAAFADYQHRKKMKEQEYIRGGKLRHE
ncbi:MAG: hypothetical protein RR817_11010 [Niameybacter sp.]